MARCLRLMALSEVTTPQKAAGPVTGRKMSAVASLEALTVQGGPEWKRMEFYNDLFEFLASHFNCPGLPLVQ